MTAPAKFKQADLRRAVAGARDAGLPIGSVEIDPHGRIIIHAATALAPEGKRNSLDRLLDKQ